MNADLDRLRRKVEAGEVLTEPEVRALEDAARAHGGPTLRLALAHAWMNADQDRRALTLLEVLVRDFPREVQVRLGLARALVAVDRPIDADRALQEALRLSPGDPEALKALATLALSRGEIRRARQYAAEALRRDPFDGEARLLKEELESSELPPESQPRLEPTARKEEFLAQVTAKLTEAKVSHLRHGKQLLLKLRGGGVARVDTGSLYAAYLEEGGPLREAVDAVVSQLSALTLGVPEEPGALLARVLPVLRPEAFVDPSGLSLWREGPAGLRVFYAIEDPELVRYVPESSLGQLGLSHEELDRAAWENLELRPAPVAPVVVDAGAVRVSEVPTGLWAVCAGDGSDPARALSRIQRERLAAHVEPPWAVSLGRRELLLACAAANAEAMVALSALQPAPDGIPGVFMLDAEGRLSLRTP